MQLKISVNLNRIPDSYHILDDFEKARLYHLKHGVDITWVFRNTSLHGYITYHQTVPLDRWLIQGSQNLVSIDPTADINMFVFDQAEWATPPGSQFPLKPETPNGNCFLFQGKPFINIGRYIQADWIQIAHEIVHALAEKSNLAGFPMNDVLDTYFHNDNPDFVGGNFDQMWHLLAPYLNSLNNNSMYKYFSPTEVAKWQLKPELWQALDKMREMAGTAFNITSGFRTPAQNIAAGGKPNSAHLKGLAVDLACSDDAKRTMMIKGVLNTGIPCFLEIALGHLHIDLDSSIHSMGWTIVSNDD